MKLLQLILIILTIVCNEIVVELVLSEELKISILDNASEENIESENVEIEAEPIVDLVNPNNSLLFNESRIAKSNIDRNISNITNPFLEIHSPPPDFF